MLGYIEAHWKGEFTPARSFWCNFIGARLVFFAAVWAAGIFLFSGLKHSDNTFLLLSINTAYTFCLLALTLWGMVGVWRSSVRAWLQGRYSAPVFYCLCALCVTLLSTASIKENARFWQAGAHERWLDRRAVISASEDSSTIVLDGPITRSSPRKMVEALEQAPDATRLMLTSEGGLMDSASTLADIVQRRGLETYVETTCSSACTVVFLAADKRTLHVDGKLGFHPPHAWGRRLRDSENKDAKGEKDSSGAYKAYFDMLRSKGADEQFVKLAKKISASGMWYPSLPVLLRNNFVTHLGNGRKIVAVPDSLKENGRADLF